MKILILHNDEKAIDSTLKLLNENGITDIRIYSDPEESKLILQLTSTRTKEDLDRLMNAAQLIQSEKKYRDVVNSQPEMIIKWNSAGEILFANKSYQEYYHLNEQELFKKSFYSMVKDKKRFNEKLSRLTPENTSLTDIHLSFEPSGKKVWHEWTDLAVFDKDKNLLEIQSIGRDITKQIESELEIKAKEEFSQSILSAIDESIAVIDPLGNIVTTNKSWKDLSLQEWSRFHKIDVGSNYFDGCLRLLRSGDEYAQKILDGIKSVLKNERNSFELEYTCHSDSVRRWFIIRVVPLISETGGAVITHTNVSDKKNKDIELQLSYNEIMTTQKINHALIAGESAESIAESILQGLNDSADVQRGRIYLYDKSTHTLTLFAERLSSELRSKIETRTGVATSKLVPVLNKGSLFDQVVRNKKIFLTHDLEKIKELISEHAINSSLKKLAGWAQKLLGIKTFGVYPLIRENEVIGLLSISTPILLNDREKEIVVRSAEHASLVFSRKMDQDELKISEEKFKAISNYTANWETWIDTGGKPIWVNPAVYNHSGYTAEELLEMPDFYRTIIHKDDYEKLIETITDAILNKTEGENLEIRCNHKNGYSLWFSISWKQIYDSAGNWLGIRSSSSDITERKRQQEQLIQKTNELREAQNVAKLGYWEWNTATEIFSLSDQLCSIIGLPSNQNQLSIEKLFYLIHTSSHQTLKEILHNAVNDFKSRDIEIRLGSLSGEDKYLLIRARTPDQKDIAEHTIKGTALDISELKQSYIKSRENEDKFQKIFESIQDVYYQTNSSGQITLLSPSVYELVGYTPDELIGKPLSILFNKPSFTELLAVKNSTADKTDQFEATLKAKNGDEIIVSINLSVIDAEKNSLKVQGILRNITERKRQEKSLESQRKRLLEIVKLNTQIIETSDHFYYVVQISNSKKRMSQLKYVSVQVAQVLGLSELELLNLDNRWYDLIHPDDIAMVNKAINKIFTQKRPQRVSYRVKHNQTGKLIWVDDYACPLFNSKNEVIEIYGSVKDVSDRVNSIIKITTEKKQSIAYQYQLLSSQLNPHFIYNTLNSFQYYILQGNVEASLNHISDFSKLMRRVLENSMSRYITIDEEISFLEQYIRISRQRMPRELKFTVENCPEVETSELLIPPMLLQPYLENALIHGFVESPRPPEIKLVFKKNEDRIECIIEDNGIGRIQSQSLKRKMTGQKTKSYGIGIIKERIDLLNQLSENDFRLNIIDLYDEDQKPLGTKVIISLNCIYSEFEDQPEL